MKNVFEIVDHTDCCGCSSCSHICGNNAIQMKADSRGFMYPTVDMDICVNCGACVKVCPEIDYVSLKRNNIGVYGIQNLDKEIKEQSTSGGLFSLLANYVLSLNGTIYGAVYDAEGIKHVRVTDDYCSLRGSKYSQSEIDGIIDLLIDDLNKGKYVLFTGTPCQCAGVRKILNHLNVSMSNLLLVDIICHGVVSPQILRDYIEYAEQAAGKRIIVHKFRDKVSGWSTYIETNIFEDGTEDRESYESQLFKRIFLSHFGFREACFNCKFSTEKRVSDITMGDFWGLKNTRPELWNDEGISLAIVYTNNGQKVIDNVIVNAEVFNASLSDTRQPQLKMPALKPNHYDDFWIDYNNIGFSKIVKKYFHGGKMRRLASELIKKLQ